MLQGHLKEDAVLLGGSDDSIPFLRDGEAEGAEVCPDLWPIEIFAIPMAHPNASPVFARAAEPGHEADDVGGGAGVPSQIMADRKETAAVGSDKTVRVGGVELHIAGAARPSNDGPVGGL